MVNFLPFLNQNAGEIELGDDLIDASGPDEKKINKIFFWILLVVVLLYFYFVIWKRYLDFKNRKPSLSKNLNLDLEEKDSLKIEPTIDLNDFVDSSIFDFESECSEEQCRELSCGENQIIYRRKDRCCPECVELNSECSKVKCKELSCGENEIILLRKDKCCPECVYLGQQNNNKNYLKRLEDLNKFVDKNIIKLKFNSNLKDIGRNTTKVTFSLIDKLSEFNYKEFNLEEFIKIFSQEDQIIYVGIILFLIGVIFLIFSK